jgi:hypothetical protein
MSAEPISLHDSAARAFASPSLAKRLFALLAPARVDADAAAEAHWLAAQAAAHPASPLMPALTEWQRSPPPADLRLHTLSKALALQPPEIFALVLAAAADSDLVASRALAWLQSPLREPYPTLGLIACLEEQRGIPAAKTLAALLDGAAVRTGLLLLDGQGRALPDCRLRLPQPLLAAIAGGQGNWPGVRFETNELPLLAPSIISEAARRASVLADALIVRSGHPLEARAACAAIARTCGRRAVFVENDAGVTALPTGLGPWLTLHDAQPVLCVELGPGERRKLPELPGYFGTLLVACGPEGSWDRQGEALSSWQIPMPAARERVGLWTAHAFGEAEAQVLGQSHRHASARIAQLATAARHLSGLERPDVRDVARAARAAGSGALGSLAELLSEDIPDDALILPPAMRRELEALLARCRARDELSADLGPAARARYRAGVRALFTGASGTGKTLACGWLATQLGLPLYRVDMASVSSKYIGETEKNLGELFARAEHAEVILLFDEADALFGKRTEVKDSNDRFANQQTNYLLQRIESCDGIALLTSNSRARFDSAFTRRLDVILEFSAPGPGERRALWLAHLGDAHTLSPGELNRLAVASDLAGGHIRNVTLAARAIVARGPIGMPAILTALGSEYRKLGKQPPAGLSTSS